MYTMSKNYDALYDLLCAGGEALGKTGHRPARMYRHIDRLFITNTSEPIEVFDIGIGEAAFKSACTRLNLEWLAPVDLAAVLEAGDGIRRAYMDVQAFAIAHLPSRALDRFVDEYSPKSVTDAWTSATAKFRK